MRHRVQRPKSFFRGTELMRLMAMIVMLAVLYLMIKRAREPAMWEWFARADGKAMPGEATEAERLAALNAAPLANADAKPAPQGEIKPREASAEAPPAKAPEKKAPEKDDAGKDDAGKKGAGKQGADAKPADAVDDEGDDFPLYTDSIEQGALKDNFETVQDKSDEVSVVEMPAYWRLMNWSRQPLEGMQRRAKRGLVFNDFIKHPDEHRGKLVQLKLHARRILVFPAPDGEGKPEGVDKVYEIIAFTDESQGWLYWILTSELPPGLKTGNNVDSDITLYGFFFKVQKYLPGDSKAGSAGFIAPLLIGRVTLDKPVVRLGEEDPRWGWWLLALGAVALALTVLGWFMSSGRRKGLTVAAPAPGDRPFEEWLAQPVLGSGDAGGRDGNQTYGNQTFGGQESGGDGMYFGNLGNNSGDLPRNSSSGTDPGPGDAGKP